MTTRTPTIPSASPPSQDNQTEGQKDVNYYSTIHNMLNHHIRKGNSLAAMLILANPSFHNDRRFWVCDQIDFNLIASLIIHDSIASTSSSGAETQVNEDGLPLNVLSANDLYVLLKRTGEDRGVVSSALRRIERSRLGSDNASENTERDNDSQVIDLAQLATALLVRSTYGGSAERDTVANPNRNQITVTKRPREEEDVVVVNHQANTHATTALQTTNVMGDEIVDAHSIVIREPKFDVVIRDPLAKPGSLRVTKTLEEFEASFVPRPVRSTQGESKTKKRQAFTEAEDAAIVKGISMFPAVHGRFAQIFHAFKDVWLPGRNPQHLLDHWRNALRDRTIGKGV